MQAVLLAAGISSRFVPFNNSLSHKSLISINGKTILEHTLLSVKRSGIEDIIIVIGKNSPIENILGNGENFGVSIKYITLPEPLGMGAAILEAKDYLQDKFFVLNAHHLEFDHFGKEMENMQKTQNTVVLLGKSNEEFEKYGFIRLEGNKVTDLIEKPDKNLDKWHRIVGIYLLNKTFLKALEETPLEHYHLETALSKYAKTEDVKAIITQKQTLTLKYAWDLFEIKDYLLKNIDSHISKTAKISKTAEISGKVFIEDGAIISEGVKIKGPCYIGKNSYIGTNSLIRNNTTIGENSVVGSFIELKNVLMMANCSTHTGVIEDSIIGQNCKIAAGIITANVRLDRKEIFTNVKEERINSKLTSLGMILGSNSQLGVRVTTMPGVIIGENSLVGPYTVVMRNLKNNTKFYTVFKEIVEENIENGKK